ncbi:Poly [ADP-ribose] polymerase [Rhynchospora pubera]|uniref:Poly [ADP-ribose] polymerase n=1 Tax=Rhynchospora pubera TaxID=906938 RepID=A0AAV8DPH8_9POAL|nr:Poly [ADP-ribose] polymerase [Rhynchospora pubera]
MDYGEDEKEDKKGKEKKSESSSSESKKTKLDCRIADFISLICNVNMMKEQLMEIGYNAKKLPLGKLSKSTILQGYEVLKRISDEIGQAKPSSTTLEHLSSEFYTVIPRDFGFKFKTSFVIDTPQKLKKKLDLVEALGGIEIVTKLIEEEADDEDDPIYARYKKLNCELTPVETNSYEFSMIKRYLTKTDHVYKRSDNDVNIVQIFRVCRNGEDDCFKKFSGTQNRMLLWHGSMLTNWAGILSQGLRIAPPEAPALGYAFGKGVYFSDMFSVSADFCGTKSGPGVLLLCEVALGEMNELYMPNYNAHNLPNEKLSTKGVGYLAPDKAEYEIIEGSVVVPLGEPKKNESKISCSCNNYNEYIVYNVDQIKMRYILHVQFNDRW